VLSRVTDLVKYATDASPYRLFPQVAVAAESPEQIAKTLQYARQNHHSATFRASGSSLHGQSQGDDILIDVRKCFVGLEVLENGLYAKIKPGMIVNAVNRALLPYGRVLGPDPASSGVATVGGVAANNASGMTAGTKLNSYHTLGLRQEVVDYLTPENRSRQKRLTIYESLSWADKKLLPNLDVKHKARSATVHPTCSMHTLGVDVTLRENCRSVGGTAVLPPDQQMLRFCRGSWPAARRINSLSYQRGDERGCRQEAGPVPCANRTCEVGMEHATRAPYQSFLYSLEELTRT